MDYVGPAFIVALIGWGVYKIGECGLRYLVGLLAIAITYR